MASLTELESAPNAIPFNDGLENLLKYAFNMFSDWVSWRARTGSGPHTGETKADCSDTSVCRCVSRFKRGGSEIGLVDGIAGYGIRSGDFVATHGTCRSSLPFPWKR